ncbi:J domain-containing protein [Gammaproteobacteria bacterium]|nr:J domain-containing protein [Gammaproteobacteria bacterium]
MKAPTETFSFDAWQLFSIHPNDTLKKFGTSEYTKNINDRYHQLSLKYHPDKNPYANNAHELFVFINNQKDYLLSDQSKSELIRWQFDNPYMLGLPPQQNKILQELGVQEPKLTSTYRILKALDWLNTLLFSGIGLAFFLLNLDLTACYYITSASGLLKYTAVTIIATVLLKNLINYRMLSPTFLSHLPYFTITALIVLCGLIQPTSISTFLTSMNPLSLICISIIAISLWVDSQMNRDAKLDHFIQTKPLALIVFLFVSKNYLFCCSINFVFYSISQLCFWICQTPWLSSTYVWYFTPHLPITGFNTTPKPLGKISPTEIKSTELGDAKTNTPQQDHPLAYIVNRENLVNMNELD